MTIFSVVLCGVMIAMLLYLLTKIGMHYYYLQQPSTLSDEKKPIKRGKPTLIDSATNSKYLAFAQTLEAPPASPLASRFPQIQTSDADISNMDDQMEFTDDAMSADYIMELPDHQSSSLINVYRQYEKHLGVESKFMDKKDKVKPAPTMRGFHFIYLLMLAAWFLVQCVVLLAKTPTSTTGRVLDALLYISHGA